MNSNPINIILILVAVSLLTSCRKNTVVSIPSYIGYIENPDNGLIKEVESEKDGLKISAKYKTAEYMAVKELGIENCLPDSLIAMANEFEGGVHFDFILSSTISGHDAIKGNLSPSDYLARITYMSGQISKDLKLVIGIDTVSCAISHFERNYNISPHNILMVVFPYTKSNDDFKLIYDDNFFGLGKVEFEFKRKNINKIPKLL